MKLRICAAGAITAAAILTPQAAGHDAVVACNPATGQYVVAADYLHLNPTSVFTATDAVVTWTDGYTIRVALPAPCVPPPAPTPPTPVPPAAPGVPTASIQPLPVPLPRTVSPALASSVRVSVRHAPCRIYGRVKPRNGVAPTRRPAYGKVRVERGGDGRWAGFRDRHVVTVTTSETGRQTIRVAWTAGGYCGRSQPAVAG